MATLVQTASAVLPASPAMKGRGRSEVQLFRCLVPYSEKVQEGPGPRNPG